MDAGSVVNLAHLAAGFGAGIVTLGAGFGIAAYGLTYFLVHDIFVHQRFKVRLPNSTYLTAIRRAHRAHHSCIEKEGAKYFGLLWVPRQFFTKRKK